MTADTQAEVPSGSITAAATASSQAEHVSFRAALLGFMLTTTLTTSLMVLLSQG
jgi:hypothetical protein